MMKKAVAALALVFCGVCVGQSTVGEVTQQGGKKLSKEDLQQLYAGGVTAKGTTRSGAHYVQQNKADGSVSGNGQTLRGSTGIYGGWKINDDGQECWDLKFTSGGSLAGCWFLWKLGDKYFAASVDAPDTAVSIKQYEK